MDNVSNLHVGIYIVKVTVNGESQVLKMIKQ